MNENMRVITTDEELKVFNHPYRMKIIRTFQKSDTPLTVKGCADIMGEVPANVHYHVKKLLDVDILELDHTEKINGITAKYYKLPKESFTISMKKDDETAMLKQLPHVHSIITNVMDEFKDVFMKASAYAVEKNIKKDHEVGMISSNTLYLSKEEFEEINDYFIGLTKKYKENGDDKQLYSFIAGIGRKFDEE